MRRHRSPGRRTDTALRRPTMRRTIVIHDIKHRRRIVSHRNGDGPQTTHIHTGRPAPRYDGQIAHDLGPAGRESVIHASGRTFQRRRFGGWRSDCRYRWSRRHVGRRDRRLSRHPTHHGRLRREVSGTLAGRPIAGRRPMAFAGRGQSLGHANSARVDADGMRRQSRLRADILARRPATSSLPVSTPT